MRAHARINLDALRHNLQRVNSLAPQARTMAVIKANAYGHGMTEVAHALQQADSFAVATVDEALALRAAGIDRDIVVLEGASNKAELHAAVQAGLSLVVHADYQLAMLEAMRTTLDLFVWLKIDTGMHRLGMDPAEAASAYRRLQQCAVVRGIGLMSHFANADDPHDTLNRQQFDRFMTATAGLDSPRSLANSAAICTDAQTHLEWVRPGIMLYGVDPLLPGKGGDLGLQPVMTLSSRLLSIHQRRRGDTIGYGASWVCPEDMPVGVVSIGYGDGYPRHARSGTPVLINGVRTPLVGRVSMDMICVDLRKQPDARVGDEVILWGEGLAIEEVAESADTIAYELLCKLTARVAFSYEHDTQHS